MELSSVDSEGSVTYYGLNDQEWGQYLQEGKTLPEIVAERPEAVLDDEQVRAMFAGKDVNAEAEMEAGQ